MTTTPKPQGRLMVVMFTDIVNSVALQERLGTDVYSQLRARHNQLFDEALRVVEGAEVLQNLGDGFLCQFPRTNDAVNAALLFQYMIFKERWQPEPLRVRVGLHLGQVIDMGTRADGAPDLVGMAVNIAARIASLAGGGQVLLSRAAYDDARHLVREHPVDREGEAPPEMFWASRGFCALKGVREPIEVFEVGAVGAAPQSPQARLLKDPGPGDAAAVPAEDRWLGRGTGAPTGVQGAREPLFSGVGGAAGTAGAAGGAAAQEAPVHGKVVLVYKRNAQPDESVLALLESRLAALGHDVFIDRRLAIGVEWAREIEQQIREAAAVVPLLSGASITSEMLSYEIQLAHAAGTRGSGRPRLLPVRVNFEGALPPDMDSVLSPLQYFLWKGPEDDEGLVQHVHVALAAPRRAPAPVRKFEVAGGAVRLDSPFYVVRRTDEEFRDALERRDTVVLIKGARQTGKTSLLARGLAHAREAGLIVGFGDLQKLASTDFESPKAFYLALGEMLADQLDLPVLPSERWEERRAPNVNFERYVRREVLKPAAAPVVWALDEVDRLFSCPFGSEVFALFRTWHNERALDPSGPWGMLTLVISYATEAHLFITDVNQSPFNIGTRLVLQDFTLEQVADLNGRYGSPLNAGPDVGRLHRLTGGQPFLVRRGLDELAGRGIGIDELERRAADEDGPFGDHLRRLLVMLAKDPELCDVMRGVVQGKPCPTSESFYRLRSAGVVNGSSARDAEPRCGIYTTYLQRHLL